MKRECSELIRGGIILMRHGEAGHNVKETYNSRMDHPSYTPEPLTEVGREQALAAAEHMKSEGLSAEVVCKVLVSPLPRTRETAALVCQTLGIPEERMVVVKELVESGVGDREGEKYSHYNDQDAWFPDNPESFGGETMVQVKERVSKVLQQVLADEDNDLSRQYVLLVSHGVPVYLMLKTLGLPAEKIAPASYRIIEKL